MTKPNQQDDEIPQDVAARFLLAAFAGSATDGHVEIRSKRGGGRPGMEQEFISVAEPARAARCALNRGQMADTYVGVAIRTRRAGGLSAIESLCVLWIDVDGQDALERLTAFGPLPAIVVRSGSDHSAHAYWPLQEPVPPAWAKRANRRLALALGADMNATDAARVLRVPGTFNFKHDPPRRVVCTRLEFETFSIADVVGHLPDDRPYVRPAARPRAVVGDVSKLLDGLTRTVHEAAVGNRNAALYWAACRVRERADEGALDATEARAVLREVALAAGLDEHETDRTLDSALEAAT